MPWWRPIFKKWLWGYFCALASTSLILEPVLFQHSSAFLATPCLNLTFLSTLFQISTDVLLRHVITSAILKTLLWLTQPFARSCESCTPNVTLLGFSSTHLRRRSCSVLERMCLNLLLAPIACALLTSQVTCGQTLGLGCLCSAFTFNIHTSLGLNLDSDPKMWVLGFSWES